MDQPEQKLVMRTSTTHGPESQSHHSLGTLQLSPSTHTTSPEVPAATSRDFHNHVEKLPTDGMSQVTAVGVWRPYALSRYVFAAFAVLFLLCIAGLEIIQQVSQHNEGLALSVSSRHYLWTYGPSAIFTLVTALWARVDYRLKQQAPWSAMAKGETPASKSVLLDYISPLQPVSIYTAIRNSHYAPALSGTLSLISALLIVVSTGLMSLDPVVLKNNQLLVPVIDSFVDQALGFNITDFDNVAYDFPLVLPYAFQHYGLDHPFGTSDTVAFQSVNTSLLPPQSLVDVVVDGFSADFDCEDAALSKHNWTETVHSGGINVVIDMHTPFCSINSVSLAVAAGLQPVTSLSGIFQNANCAGRDGPESHRVVLFVGKSVQHTFDDAEGNQKANVSISESLQKICTPRYSISRYQLTVNTSNPGNDYKIVSLPHAGNRTLSQLPVSELSKCFFIPMNSEYTSVFTKRTSQPSRRQLLHNLFQSNKQSISLNNPDAATWYSLASHGYQEYQSQEWLRPGVFEDLCRSTYRSYLVQFAKREIMGQDLNLILGHIQTHEDRIAVHTVTARLMEALLAVLLLIVVALLFSEISLPVLPRDVAKLAGLSAVLATQPCLRTRFSYMTSDQDSVVKKKLDPYLYHTVQEQLPAMPQFLITETENPACQSLKSPEDTMFSTNHWWQPFAVQRTTLVPMCAGICAIIAALEAILHVSQVNHGLVDTNTTNYGHYVWTLVPAAIMTGIKFYYQAVNFSGKVLAPFAKLKAGFCHQDSLSTNFLDLIAPISMWVSLTRGHGAVFLTTVTALFGNLLSIAVSGVYSNADVPFQQAVALQQQDYFNLTNYQNADQSKSGLVTGLTLNLGLPYHAGTYEDLVLPMFTSASNTTDDHEIVHENGNLQARIPVIYPDVTCKIYRGSQVPNVSYENGYLGADLPVRGNCGDGGNNKFLVSAYGTFAAAFTPYWLLEPRQHDCTYLGYLWGHIQAGKVEHITGLSCSEGLAQVEADVTLLLPSFQVDPNHPPGRDLSTFQRSSIPPLSAYYEFLPVSSSPEGMSLDNFFLTLISGKDAIPASFLSGIDRIEEVEAAIIKLHKLIRAQQWSSAGIRTPLPRGSSAPQLSATITYSSRVRLVQNATSTRVLEALLGAIVIGTVCIIFRLKSKQILPHCPCSISGMAGLLVDSQLLDHLPPDSSGMTDAQLLELLSKYRYKLGWFRPGKGSENDDSPIEAERYQEWEAQSRRPRQAYGIYIVGVVGAAAGIESETTEEKDSRKEGLRKRPRTKTWWK